MSASSLGEERRSACPASETETEVTGAGVSSSPSELTGCAVVGVGDGTGGGVAVGGSGSGVDVGAVDTAASGVGVSVAAGSEGGCTPIPDTSESVNDCHRSRSTCGFVKSLIGAGRSWCRSGAKEPASSARMRLSQTILTRTAMILLKIPAIKLFSSRDLSEMNGRDHSSTRPIRPSTVQVGGRRSFA